MSTSVSLAEARARFSELVGRAEDHHERIVITVHGKPVAVIMGMYDYESLMETLDVLSDPDVMADLEQSEKELNEGLAQPLPERRDVA